MIAATSLPPETSASSSVSIKLVITNTVASVPTTFSFAMNPVIAAAANCQLAKPTTGIKSTANGEAIIARIESELSSAATANPGVNVAIT